MPQTVNNTLWSNNPNSCASTTLSVSSSSSTSSSEQNNVVSHSDDDSDLSTSTVEESPLKRPRCVLIDLRIWLKCRPWKMVCMFNENWEGLKILEFSTSSLVFLTWWPYWLLCIHQYQCVDIDGKWKDMQRKERLMNLWKHMGRVLKIQIFVSSMTWNVAMTVLQCTVRKMCSIFFGWSFKMTVWNLAAGKYLFRSQLFFSREKEKSTAAVALHLLCLGIRLVYLTDFSHTFAISISFQKSCPCNKKTESSKS